MVSIHVPLLFVAALLVIGHAKVPLTEFFPNGVAKGDTLLPSGDDTSSEEIKLDSPFPFFEVNHTSLYVNVNGAISFLKKINTYVASCGAVSRDFRMVGPFWADVITTPRGSKPCGTITYRKSTTPADLDKAKGEILRAFNQFSTLTLKYVYIVTWLSVCGYNTPENYRNTWQATIATDGVHSFAIFYYNDITWDQLSVGSWQKKAQAGFDFGDSNRFYMIDGSCTAAMLTIDDRSNVGKPGTWVFRVDSTKITAPPNNTCDAACPPGHYKGVPNTICVPNGRVQCPNAPYVNCPNNTFCGRNNFCIQPGRLQCPNPAINCPNDTYCGPNDRCVPHGFVLCSKTSVMCPNNSYCGRNDTCVPLDHVQCPNSLNTCPNVTTCGRNDTCVPEGFLQCQNPTFFCPENRTYCGRNDTCIPTGAVQCPNPAQFCLNGTYCGRNNTCIPNGEKQCPNPSVSCPITTYCGFNNTCVPLTATQCPNSTIICMKGFYCGVKNRCVPNGHIQCPDVDFSCPHGTNCGTNRTCILDPTVCPNSTKKCAAGQYCGRNEICVPGGSTQCAFNASMFCANGTTCSQIWGVGKCLGAGDKQCQLNPNLVCKNGTYCGAAGLKCVPDGFTECRNPNITCPADKYCGVHDHCIRKGFIQCPEPDDHHSCPVSRYCGIDGYCVPIGHIQCSQPDRSCPDNHYCGIHNQCVPDGHIQCTTRSGNLATCPEGNYCGREEKCIKIKNIQCKTPDKTCPDNRHCARNDTCIKNGRIQCGAPFGNMSCPIGTYCARDKQCVKHEHFQCKEPASNTSCPNTVTCGTTSCTPSTTVPQTFENVPNGVATPWLKRDVTRAMDILTEGPARKKKK